MDIFTRIVLLHDDVAKLSTRKIIATLRTHGIDPDQAFWTEVNADRIVIERCRNVRPQPKVNQSPPRRKDNDK